VEVILTSIDEELVEHKSTADDVGVEEDDDDDDDDDDDEWNTIIEGQ
jgi:hypothetical protein